MSKVSGQDPWIPNSFVQQAQHELPASNRARVPSERMGLNYEAQTPWKDGVA
jgi:hypothetical protein